jgi:sigma-B regulation protein RsbU (phosphoserine phosphatase)
MPNRILVVDDEPDLEVLITQLFRKRIRGEELSFLFAGNGEEALARLQADDHVDVVLTDINMPVMDGLTLLSRLREAHPLLCSVIVSAYGDMPNIRTALNRGAFDFITKPIDFEDLEITLDKAIREAVERKQAAQDRDQLLKLSRELELARGIQEALVPRVFTIGDVSGKGIAAALFMAVSRTVLRVAASKGLSPQACLLEAHQFLYGERRATSHFVTCFYGILDLATGQLDYSRAGHNPPYLVRGDQVQTLDAASGLPLGMLRKVSYDTATAQLAAGDTLLLFTDGITEAMNPRQEEYGEERLVQMLSARAASLSVEELVRLVTQEAIAFAEGAPASDDMTMLSVWYG